MGRFLAKEYLVICGLEVAEAVFLHLDAEIPEIETAYVEGDEVEEGTVFGTLKGYAMFCLRASASRLNILQRMCGVATLTRAYVKAVEGTEAQIVDTRKTTPGLRFWKNTL
jgi:nicotinate-nucleotide pyrophosphorylase (carboxylating)